MMDTDGRFTATSPGALLTPFGSQQGPVLAGSTGHTFACFDSAKDVSMYVHVSWIAVQSCVLPECMRTQIFYPNDPNASKCWMAGSSLCLNDVETRKKGLLMSAVQGTELDSPWRSHEGPVGIATRGPSTRAFQWYYRPAIKKLETAHYMESPCILKISHS